MSVEIQLSRADRVYRPGDKVQGVVVVRSKGSLSHNGIVLEVEGGVQLQLSSKSVGLFEAFATAVRPIEIIHLTMELAQPGKLPDGVTEVPFEFPLLPNDPSVIYETYHGVYVTVSYTISVEVARPLLAKNLSRATEFIVEVPPKEQLPAAHAVPFLITPESLENVGKASASSSVPKFRVSGKLTSAVCPITRPLVGEVLVEECEAPIQSIEIQLVRIETCGTTDGYAKEATEIQNIQIADGDICRGMVIPIYMVFPRLFTCPTVVARTFRVEFEVNLVVVFDDGHLVTENFQIKLYRP